jgi:DNA-directed RNA polymerase specialized sigma subunit
VKSEDKMAVRELINYGINKMIKALKNEGFMRDEDDVIYAETAKILRDYYNGVYHNDPEEREKKEDIEKALDSIKRDQYYDVITMYYGNRETIEFIAEMLDVDVSTVVRNKKRLCLEIYSRIM